MNITYINKDEELGMLRIGQEAYYKGKFFSVRRLKRISSNSAACPCATEPCAFNRMRLDSGELVCKFFKQCTAVNRFDGEPVAFVPVSIAGDKLKEFKAWCKKNEKPFSI